MFFEYVDAPPCVDSLSLPSPLFSVHTKPMVLCSTGQYLEGYIYKSLLEFHSCTMLKASEGKASFPYKVDVNMGGNMTTCSG